MPQHPCRVTSDLNDMQDEIKRLEARAERKEQEIAERVDEIMGGDDTGEIVEAIQDSPTVQDALFDLCEINCRRSTKDMTVEEVMYLAAIASNFVRSIEAEIIKGLSNDT